MAEKSRKVIFAAGGTGGHLFPAQALAKELREKYGNIDILFVGGDLGNNRCFSKENFPYQDIRVATPFRRGLFASLKTIYKGFRECIQIIKREKPKLVMGFGSYHAFPMLLAALLMRVPYAIFESDAVPGKVNRLFARWAHLRAVQFAKAGDALSKGAIQVNMPIWACPSTKPNSCEEARAYFSLDPAKVTVLVFGGSQGSQAINRVFSDTIALLSEKERQIQVIHLTGKSVNNEELKRHYDRQGIPACVKEFEERMHFAWQAASMAICRAGAATVAEQTSFEVPSILIPYPFASDDHQQKNALFMEREVGGAVCLSEADLDPENLYVQMRELLVTDRLTEMQQRLRLFKHGSNKEDLSTLLKPFL